MNIQRAKEISESPIFANVTVDGQRVYIQHVDERTGMARIYPLDDPENEQNVSVDTLMEH